MPLTDGYVGRVFTRDNSNETDWYGWKIINEGHYLIAGREATYKPMVNETPISFNPTVLRKHADANSIQIINNESIMFERLKTFEVEFNFDLLQTTGNDSSCDLSFQMSTDNINWTQTQLVPLDILANNEAKQVIPLFLITESTTNGLNECRYGRAVVKNLDVLEGIDYKVRLKCVEI